MNLSWVEISVDALKYNVEFFRELIGSERKLLMCVKANAYGHGLIAISKVLERDTSVDFLGVNALFEAEELRKNGINLPVLILGYVLLSDLSRVVENGFHISVANMETLDELIKISSEMKKKVFIHLKIETGLNRLGVLENDIYLFIEKISSSEYLELTGVYSHFANVENALEHEYPDFQLENFNRIVKEKNIQAEYLHMSASAAAMLFPNARFDLSRLGIVGYGLWPSKETKKSFMTLKKDNVFLKLRPVLSWKTKVAQIKAIPNNTAIGYGCTYVTDQETKLAIVPVGYYDGYDRGLSNIGHVLIRGEKASIRGTVCMNMFMVDVTHILDVSLEDEVVLIGKQGEEEISADYMASLLKTINYEVVTRINEVVERRLV